MSGRGSAHATIDKHETHSSNPHWRTVCGDHHGSSRGKWNLRLAHGVREPCQKLVGSEETCQYRERL